MYSLFRVTGLKFSLQHELVPFLLALLIAQAFFKWGSFSLELVGFIATWSVLGFLTDKIQHAIKR